MQVPSINETSRDHQAVEAIHRLSRLRDRVSALVAAFDKRIAEATYAVDHLADPPQTRDRGWTG